MSQRAIEEGVSNFNSSGLIVLELFSDLAPPLIGPDPLRVDGRIAGVDTRGAAVDLAVGETVILLHPPSTFSRCFNRDKQGVPSR